MSISRSRLTISMAPRAQSLPLFPAFVPALSTFKNIKTESVGDGKERSIVIKYVGTIKSNESNKANENNALE